ncbi:MAG: ABC transporter permease, partial [Planctomycetes bacterium]|nr:ABC transporter permease [Planctomycetota bacterium]
DKNHDFFGDCIVGTDSLVGFAYYDDLIAELNGLDFVVETSPVAKGFGLMTISGIDWNRGIEITGLIAARHARVTNFGQTLYYNREDPGAVFTADDDTALPGCVYGIDVIPSNRDSQGQYYHSQTAYGYELVISCFPLTAKGGLAKAGLDLANTKSFRSTDDSNSGLPKIDGRMVFMSLGDAQQMLGMAGPEPRASAIHIKFTDGTDVAAGCEKIDIVWQEFLEKNKDRQYASLLENVTVQSWQSHRRGSIAPMEKEQTMLMFVFSMLGIITIFIIFVVFYMVISHKSKDIGILKSVGVSKTSIVGIFLAFASIIGVIGAAIGTVAGCAFLARINNLEDWLFVKFQWQLWDRSVYAIGDIPNKIEWHVLAIIAVSALAVSLVGAVIPTLRAAGKQPVEILRVDML